MKELVGSGLWGDKCFLHEGISWHEDESRDYNQQTKELKDWKILTRVLRVGGKLTEDESRSEAVNQENLPVIDARVEIFNQLEEIKDN